jgi:hypothetical protein
MATITIGPTNGITQKFDVVYIGGTLALNTTNFPWYTADKVERVNAKSPNRQGYTSTKPGATIPGITQFAAVATGFMPNVYELNLKAPITLDSAQFFVLGSTAPALTPLATPTGLQAVGTSGSAINVVANSVPNASGYQLYTSATQAGTYAKLGGVLSSPNFSHTGLGAAQTQWYRWVATGDNASYSDSPTSAAFSGTTQSVGAGTPIDVFVASGQSNLEGATIQDTNKVFSRFRIYNFDTDAVEAITINGLSGNNMGGTYPSNRLTTPFFGPEDGMATYYEANNPSPASAVLIKYAFGGATIEQFMTGGVYRARLDAAVNNGLARLVAQGFAPTIRGIYWNQWEGNQSESTASYQSKLTSLFQSFFWLPPTAKQIIMLANTELKPVAGGVRNAQLNYISGVANARYIDPLGRYVYQTTPGNDVHYDAATMRLSGRDFWDAYNRPTNALPGQTGAAPSISSFSPQEAVPGTTVNIDGANFTSTSAVQFAGLSAGSVTYVSPSRLQAIVPQGAGNLLGAIRVLNPGGGTATSPGFVGFRPAVLTYGSDVTKSGVSTYTSAIASDITYAMGTVQLPAGTVGQVIFEVEGTSRLVVMGFCSTPTPPAGFAFDGGIFLSDADATGDISLSGTYKNANGAGNVTEPPYVASPAQRAKYVLTRDINSNITISRFNGTTVGFINGRTEANSGALYLGIAFLGTAAGTAKIVNVRQSW